MNTLDHKICWTQKKKSQICRLKFLVFAKDSVCKSFGQTYILVMIRQTRYLSRLSLVTVCLSAPVRVQQTPEQILDAVIKINQETWIKDISVQSAAPLSVLESIPPAMNRID